MLISFFRNSKSFSFILITLFAVLLFVSTRLFNPEQEISTRFIFKEAGLLICLLGSIFMINHIARKNDTRVRGSLTAVLFSLLLFCIPEAVSEGKIIVSVLFTTIGLYPLMKLRSQGELIRKIFDSSIFLTLAIFIYPPAILFITLPTFAILAFLHLDFRYFLVPFTAFAALWILASCYTLLESNLFFNPFTRIPNHPYSIAALQAFHSYYWAMGFLFLFLLFALFHQRLQLPSGPSPERKWFSFQLFLIFCALFTVFLSPFYETSASPALLFLFIPASINIGTYFSLPHKEQLKAILFILLWTISIFFALNAHFHLIG